MNSGILTLFSVRRSLKMLLTRTATTGKSGKHVKFVLSVSGRLNRAFHRSLSPPLVLHEGHEYDSTVDADDEMYYSELEDAATGPAESWNFMSRPPPPVGIGSDLCYGSEDVRKHFFSVHLFSEESSGAHNLTL